MMNTGRRNDRLGPLSRDLLEELISMTDEDESLTRESIKKIIREANARDAERFWDEEPERFEMEIKDIVDSLLNRGYLYEVDGEIYITDRDIFEA